MPSKNCLLRYKCDSNDRTLLGDISPADTDELSGAKSCAWNIATSFLKGDTQSAQNYLAAANKFYSKHLRGFIAGYVEALMDRERRIP